MMAQFDDLLIHKAPPQNRISRTDGEFEVHLTEPAVMLAWAMHLFEEYPNMRRVEIHPDGEHGKQFDIRGWLEIRGYKREKAIGTTKYGGLYHHEGKEMEVSLKPGLGDVVGYNGEETVVAECKGGIVNTRHAGQLSRLRRGLCEVVGLLMTRDTKAERQMAVVSDTKETEKLAFRMAPRCHLAGIEIALVNASGEVRYIKPT